MAPRNRSSDAVPEVRVDDWPRISRTLDTNNDYLVMKIDPDRFSDELIPRLLEIAARQNIIVVAQQLYCDSRDDTRFLVFKLEHDPPPISFESLYFDLPDGIDFHFYQKSPVADLSV